MFVDLLRVFEQPLHSGGGEYPRNSPSSRRMSWATGRSPLSVPGNTILSSACSGKGDTGTEPTISAETSLVLTAGIAKVRSMKVGDVRQFEWIAPLYDIFTPEIDVSMLKPGLKFAERPLERVLDIGGGTGRAARSVTADRRIVADPALGMLAQARDHDLEVVRADGAKLPVRDASIDAVLIVDALHHISDRRGALTEAHRVLRPGGVLIVVEFDPTTVRGRLLVAGEHLLGFNSAFQPPELLRDSMARSGFETTTIERGFAYTIVGSKARTS